jgi:hypothetical protein
MRPGTERRLAPLAVAALVLAVIAVVWWVLRVAGPAGTLTGPGAGGGSTSAEPAPLRLVGWLPPGSDSPDPRYHLAPGAALPTGPGTADLHRLAPADVEAARSQVGSAVVSEAEPASGWLQRGTSGPAYPLVTARAAYDTLVRTPLPMPLMACPEPVPPGMDTVTCGGPVSVTGARLGLSLQDSQDGLLLVPAWLFDVAGSPQPLAELAVEPRLLRTAPAAGGSSGVSIGSAGTASAAPGGPATGVPPNGSRFTSVTRAADDRSLDVTFWGGVAECYSYAARAVESDGQVRLSLVENRTAGDKPCIDLAMEITKSVRLDAPLGARQVLDAGTGDVLLGPVR